METLETILSENNEADSWMQKKTKGFVAKHSKKINHPSMIALWFLIGNYLKGATQQKIMDSTGIKDKRYAHTATMISWIYNLAKTYAVYRIFQGCDYYITGLVASSPIILSEALGLTEAMARAIYIKKTNKPIPQIPLEFGWRILDVPYNLIKNKIKPSK